MKKILTAFLLLACTQLITAQENYPEPEFSNEIYAYRKDSATKVLRLEKTSSQMDTKTKMGGIGGYESSYLIEGVASPVRFRSGNKLSFVFSNGGAKSAFNMDSMMRANGMDPSKTPMIPGMGGGDPSSTFTLYKVVIEKTNRKIIYIKMGGAIGSKKNTASDKYSFSARKIRKGYWEMLIDKILPKGEYAFTAMGMGNSNGGISIFAFGVD